MYWKFDVLIVFAMEDNSAGPSTEEWIRALVLSANGGTSVLCSDAFPSICLDLAPRPTMTQPLCDTSFGRCLS